MNAFPDKMRMSVVKVEGSQSQKYNELLILKCAHYNNKTGMV